MKKLLVDRPKPERLSDRTKIISDQILNLFKEQEELSSFAIYGDWGSGKTSICKSVYNQLASFVSKSEPITEKGSYYIPIWFEAWRFQHEEAIFPAMLRTIGAEIATNAKSAKAIKLSKKLVRSSLAILKSTAYSLKGKASFGKIFGVDLGVELSGKDLLNKLDEELKKINESTITELSKIGQSPYFEAYDTLKSLVNDVKINDKSVKFVIFIDDLDRCLPEVAFEILEQIKIWLDIDGYSICFALNKHEIDNVVQNYFGSHMKEFNDIEKSNSIKKLTSEYLDKIINFGIYINEKEQPSYIAKNLEFVKNILEEKNEEDILKELKKRGLMLHYVPRKLFKVINECILESKIQEETNELRKREQEYNN